MSLIDRDFAADVMPKPRPKDLPYANRPWAPEEQMVVLEKVQPHIRVAIAQIMNTGLDPSDALNLKREQIDQGTIWGMRGKTKEKIAIPIGPRLEAELKAAPQHDANTILATLSGRPWTYNGFSTVWHRFKKKLGESGEVQQGLTLKGLHHTVATTLREAGRDEREIADLLGQKTPAMARHYSRQANLADHNKLMMETLEKQNKIKSKLSN